MPIQKVAVIGSGTMGAGIVQLVLQNGYPAVMYDINDEILNKAKETIYKRLERLNEKGRLSVQELEAAKPNLTLATDLKEVGNCDLIIEAVPEKLELKKSIFKDVSAISKPGAILATNTSSLSVTQISTSVDKPEYFLGMHFFNPAPLMPLVEVVKGMKTDPQAAEQVVDFAKKLHKTPVLCEDTPGFIVNRIARPFYNEAIRIMSEQLASPEQIDRIMKKAGNFKMGPFELQDLIGIDVNFSSTKSVHEGFFGESRFRPQPFQERMVQAGILGRKTNKGYYDYE